MIRSTVNLSARIAVALVVFAGWHWPLESSADDGSLTRNVDEARGIYIATDPLINKERALPATIYEENLASGIYVRLVWSEIEPAPGVYDFGTLDTELERIIKTGRKLSLSIITGARTPDWFTKSGIDTLSFLVGRGGVNRACIPVTVPLPWDDGYIKAFGRLVAAVGAHLRATPGAWEALKIVKLTGINQFTEELRMPADFGRRDECGDGNASDVWLTHGYSVDKVVGAWIQIAQMVAATFPDKLLALDVLERNDFPAVDEAGRAVAVSPAKEAIISHGLRSFPNRFAVQWNGLTGGGRLAKTPLMAKKKGAALGWQTNAFRGFEGSGCNNERRAKAYPCDMPGYTAILARGVESGAAYIEVWPDDALAFPTATRQADVEIRR